MHIHLLPKYFLTVSSGPATMLGTRETRSSKKTDTIMPLWGAYSLVGKPDTEHVIRNMTQ